MLYPKNLQQNKFGRLKPIRQVGVSKHKMPLWECKCDCGNFHTTSRNKLVTGRTRSCGCLRIDEVTKRSTKHGMSKTRIHGIFRGMRGRCFNKNNESYIRYGGRGITVE